MRSEISLHERRNKQFQQEIEEHAKYKQKKEEEVFHMNTWISEKDA